MPVKSSFQLLKERVDELKPLMHVFGHIHYSYGAEKINDTLFVNASICTEQYNPINKPIVVSTWRFGIEANAAAWEILKQKGRALDAVEAGVKIPEGDPTERSVGYGGRPDRDGRVTLDACIMDYNSNCGSWLN